MAFEGRDWVLKEDFRGEPNSEVRVWWFGDDGEYTVDDALLGESGQIVGKGGCGADYCTHVMPVKDGDLPPPPKQ